MVSKEPFSISVENLNRYLDLSPNQFNEVSEINGYFLELQKKSLKSSPDSQKKQVMQAVYDNLQSMKNVLSPKQYQRYLILLNVMNNNEQKASKKINTRMYLTNNMEI